MTPKRVWGQDDSGPKPVEFIHAINDFVKETRWGFCFDECLRYLSGRFEIDFHTVENSEAILKYIDRYLRSKYKHSPQWGILASALLQGYYYKSHFLDRGKSHSARTRGNLKTRHIIESSFIYAHTPLRAYARLFVEIESDIDEMINQKIVTPNCGYQVLKSLAAPNKRMNIRELMSALKFAPPTIKTHNDRQRFKNGILAALISANFILETNGKYLIHPHIWAALSYSRKIKESVLNWPYRINWILPLRK